MCGHSVIFPVVDKVFLRMKHAQSKFPVSPSCFIHHESVNRALTRECIINLTIITTTTTSTSTATNVLLVRGSL